MHSDISLAMLPIIDITFSHFGLDYHVKVNTPSGVGSGTYWVMINNYFVCMIVKYNTGWQLGVRTEIDERWPFYSDDIGAILDVIMELE